MPSVDGSSNIDSDQENNPSNANMSRKTPQQRKLTYRNLLNKIEGIRKYLVTLIYISCPNVIIIYCRGERRCGVQYC